MIYFLTMRIDILESMLCTAPSAFMILYVLSADGKCSFPLVLES